MSARGSCPTLLAPMQTGDGLLARLTLPEPIALEKFSSLCAAAEEHGNGIIEVTQRGSLQIRGLREASAPKFATLATDLQIRAQVGPPLVTSPLLGLDPGEPFDSTSVVASLLSALQRIQPELKLLAPKVSVLVDGGGRLHLDAINADIRLVAVPDALFQLSIAGTASDARHLGYVELQQAPAVAVELLRILAHLGPTARAKELVDEPALRAIRQSLKSQTRSLSELPTKGKQGGASWGAPRHSRPGHEAETAATADPLGIHVLKNGTRALGFALPFGHTTAGTLKRVAQSAADYGATSIRPAPGRALLGIGLSSSAAVKFAEFVARETFLVEARDPRRHVIACAGAPACAAALMSTRQMAQEVARATQTWAGTSKIVHLSGCSKGCAHPGVAALTIVGPDRVIVNGRASDPPRMTVLSIAAGAAGPPGRLSADIARLCGEI